MSIVQGLAVYAFSFRDDALLALGGNSGNPIYDVRFCFLLSLPLSLTPGILSVLHRSRTEPIYRLIRHQIVQ